jgi:hypothetical protein
MKITPFSLVALGLAGAAQAGTPKVERTEGTVVSISKSEIVLSKPGHRIEKIKLLPGWTVAVSKPISVEQIQPGSYLGTTNYAKPDGTGRSTEVHVSPPGRAGPGLDFLMDAAAQTTMTNGTMATVVKSASGRVLEINYGSGVRRVTVPPGTPVVLNTPGSQALVKPGIKVRLVNFTPAGGGPPHQFITVGEKGAPPPG